MGTDQTFEFAAAAVRRSTARLNVADSRLATAQARLSRAQQRLEQARSSVTDRRQPGFRPYRPTGGPAGPVG
ncbi:hypothetical protein ACH498_25100 [Rhodococcus erythropolis]